MIRLNITKEIHTSNGFTDLEIAITVARGDITAVTGRSGSGKTTFLRCISGLCRPRSGIISICDDIWYHSVKKINIPTHARDIAFAFQDYGLFPNMNVHNNISYGARDKKRISDYIDMMELTGLEKRYPHNLSGGQKQRLSLARALAREPGMLLLDEPLSSLEPELRYRLQQRIIEYHNKYHCTIILVSHEQHEISQLCSRNIRLDDGKVIEDSKFRRKGTWLERLKIV